MLTFTDVGREIVEFTTDVEIEMVALLIFVARMHWWVV